MIHIQMSVTLTSIYTNKYTNNRKTNKKTLVTIILKYMNEMLSVSTTHL